MEINFKRLVIRLGPDTVRRGRRYYALRCYLFRTHPTAALINTALFRRSGFEAANREQI